jgi:putative ABC transport system permease protein
MPLWKRIPGLLPWILWRRREERELEEEIRFHLAEEQRLRVERGETPVEARQAAHRDFGNVRRVKEVTREMWNWQTLESVLRDGRYALRQLRRTPGFSAVAIATLALGIGANTAIFSVVDAVLLRPLPYPEADRLVSIHEALPDASYLNVSWPDFLDWREQNRVFDDVGVFQPNSVKVRENGEPSVAPAAFVSASLFASLGAKPMLGRLISAEDDQPAAPAAVVLSYEFWRRTLKSDSDLANKTVNIEGYPVPVAGVLPPGFRLPQVKADVYLPLVRMMSGSASFVSRGNHPGLMAIARLRSGITLDRARTDMNTIMSRLAQAYPASNRGETARLDLLPDLLLGAIRPELLMLLGAAALVLLLACANVAHLALARASARQREFAIRGSLGAGRGRLMRQLLTESTLLSLAGGATGVALAHWSIPPLVRLSPYQAPGLTDAHVDARILLFTLLASLLAALLFGCAPILHAARAGLSLSSRAGDIGRAGRSFRSALFITEVAIALVLATGAGLLLRSVFGLLRVDPGFHAEHLIGLGVVRSGDATPERSLRFFNEAVDRVAHQPGVLSASAAMCPPLSGTCWTSPYWVDGPPSAPGGQRPWTALNMITPAYFATIQTPLLSGRAFTKADRVGSRSVAIVNRTMASMLANGNAIGRLVHVQYSAYELLEVVGVVPDVKQFGVGVPVMPEVYVPAAQMPVSFMTIVVRSTSMSGAAAAAAIRSVDKEQPITQTTVLSEAILQSAGRQRFAALLLSMFGFVALALAAVGISGVMAYTVARRTRELGIRMALGARRSEVLGLVLRQALIMVSIGVLLGLGLAGILTRLVRNLLYGVQPHDIPTFAAATLLLAVCALAACILPAWRAAHIDPVEALRHE